MTERLSRKEIQERRGNLRARLVAEQARGWPTGVQGWTGDMSGYIPLDDIPVRDISEFGLDGLEPMVPGEADLPDRATRTGELFDDLDKVDRKRAMRGQYPHYLDVA